MRSLDDSRQFLPAYKWQGTDHVWATDPHLCKALHSQDPRLKFYVPAKTVVMRIEPYAKMGNVETEKDVWYSFADLVVIQAIHDIHHLDKTIIFTFRIPNSDTQIEVTDNNIEFQLGEQ